jgi:hypothetical protein
VHRKRPQQERVVCAKSEKALRIDSHTGFAAY